MLRIMRLCPASPGKSTMFNWTDLSFVQEEVGLERQKSADLRVNANSIYSFAFNAYNHMDDFLYPYKEAGGTKPLVYLAYCKECSNHPFQKRLLHKIYSIKIF